MGVAGAIADGRHPPHFLPFGVAIPDPKSGRSSIAPLLAGRVLHERGSMRPFGLRPNSLPLMGGEQRLKADICAQPLALLQNVGIDYS